MQGQDSVGAAHIAIKGSLRLEQSRWGGVVGVGEGCWVQASLSTPGSREGVTPKLSS